MNKYFIAFFFFSLLIFNACKEDSVTNVNTNSRELISAFEVNKQVLFLSVNTTTSGLSYYFKKNNCDEATQKNYTSVFIEDIRFFDNLSGYYYCYDTNMVCVAHPVLKSYIGQNHLEDVDSKGTKFAYIIRDSLRLNGSGYVEYYWKNQNSADHELKVVYFSIIKWTKLFIGADVFQDYQKGWMLDSVGMKRELIRNIVHSTAKGFSSIFKHIISDSLQRIDFMKAYLDSLRFFNDRSGYFFVDDTNHFSVVFPTEKGFEGTSLYDYVDPKGNYPVRSMVEVIKQDGRGFVEYYFTNPATNKSEKKFVYVEKIEGTEYFIGTGVYF
jgi:signal transduction histidine kinase